MANRKPIKPTELEAVIMEAVWALSEATVKQVQEHLHQKRPMAYTTVLTMMQILRRKGFLTSTRRGRADVYRPKVTQAQMAQRSLRDLLGRFFAGSPAALVSQLLKTKDLTREEVEAIRREIDQCTSDDQSKRGDK
jgi:predicted transcriptional regulator